MPLPAAIDTNKPSLGSYGGGGRPSVNSVHYGYDTKTADRDLAALNESIFARFEKDLVPLLEDMQKSIETRREDYVAGAREDALNAVNQSDAQAELRRSALGAGNVVSLAERQKAKSLGYTATEAFGVNNAIDAADDANAEAATTLMNIASGMEGSAIGNLSNSASMANGRVQTGINRDAQAKSQQMQGAATIAMMAMMMM